MAQCPSALMPFADTAARLALPMTNRCNGGISRNINKQSALSLRANSDKANQALGRSNMALITYLSNKMKAAKQSKPKQYDSFMSSSMECFMLGTWLTELHLQERENGANNSKSQQQQVNHALLHQFLSSFVRDMDPRSIINVLASHDISAGECAGYSAAGGDIGAAVNAALSGEDEKVSFIVRLLNNTHLALSHSFFPFHLLPLLTEEWGT